MARLNSCVSNCATRWKQCISHQDLGAGQTILYSTLAGAEVVCGVFVTHRSLRFWSRLTYRRLCVLTKEELIIFDCEAQYQAHVELRRQRALEGEWIDLVDDLNLLRSCESSALARVEGRRALFTLPLSQVTCVREINTEEFQVECKFGRQLLIQTEDSAICATRFCQHFGQLKIELEYGYEITSSRIREQKHATLLFSTLPPPPWATFSDDVDDECVLCLDPLCADPMVCLHPCAHKLHRKCAELWMSHDLETKSSLICPLCRAVLCEAEPSCKHE